MLGKDREAVLPVPVAIGTRAAAMTEGMPNAEFFRGRVEMALREIVAPQG